MDLQADVVEKLQQGGEFEDDEREYVGDYEEGDEFEEGEEEMDGEIEEDEGQETATAEQLIQQMQQMQYIRGLEPVARPNGATGSSGNRQPGAQSAVRDWSSLSSLPGATQQSFLDLLGQLKSAQRQDLTILFLGKGGVGKSSTANSLFGDRVASVAAFQSDSSKPTLISRTAAGFTMNVLDTPGLYEGDALSTTAFQQVSYALEDVRPDVVFYFDRLDLYRVEAEDKEVLESVTATFGKGIWSHTVLCLTHANCQPPDANMTYDEFISKRAGALRKAIGAAGAPSSAALPLVLVDNSSRCPENKGGEKVGPTGKAWLPAMMGKAVELALQSRGPYRYSRRMRRGANPNNKRKWLIPLVLIAQVLFKMFVLERVLEDDRVSGDQYGPFDQEYVQEERERIRREKEANKKKKAKKNTREDDSSSSSSESDYEEEEEQEDEDED